MELSSSEAAKAVGISKQSIIRAIHRGKVSAVRNPSGEFVIDTSELFRAYQPVSPSVTNGTEGDGKGVSNYTPDQCDVLRERVSQLDARLRERDETISDLRQRLDASQAQVSQLTAVMTQLQPKQAKAGWWTRLLGGA